MPENLDNITASLLKYMDGTLTLEEQQLLDQWIAASAENRRLWEEINDKDLLQASLKGYAQKAAVFHSYEMSAAPVHSVNRSFLQKYWHAAAAILILVTTTCIYLFFHTSPKATTIVHAGKPVTPDVAPASNKATLTLADGSILQLDSAANGNLAQQSGMTVNLKNGQLRYDASHSSDGVSAALVYNTVTTPKGGIYRILLPDGSTAWLNAASSLRFSLNTTTPYRLVEASGEIYFEVKKDPLRPFFVKVSPTNAGSNHTLVQVLGTHFDVNAYGDQQQTSITLVEGRVQVKTSRDESKLDVQDDQRRKALLSGPATILKPGERAITNERDEQVLVEKTVASNAITWVNGDFYFNQAELSLVMKEVERWYDITFIYDPAKVNVKYEGFIPRTTSLSKFLTRLERIGNVQFRLEGKTVRVLP